MNLSEVDINNPQQVFDFVVEKLQQQGEPSMISGSTEARCLYRGPNGNRCAVGHLIPDDKYDPEIEGMYCGGIPYLQTAIQNKAVWPLIAHLQRIHDNIKVDCWEREFRSAAQTFGLSTDHLDYVYSTKLLEATK